MMKPSLKIKGLHVQIENKEILKGVDLVINGGEVHAIMGPNGTGKSTLASSVMGHPSYEITAGSISLNGEDVLEMEVDERARKGLFLAMQSPREVSGVTNSDFMFAALNNYRNERGQEPISRIIFGRDYLKLAAGMKIDDLYAERYLNEGFSGGERKRNEILQMKVLQPNIAILDETDPIAKKALQSELKITQQAIKQHKEATTTRDERGDDKPKTYGVISRSVDDFVNTRMREDKGFDWRKYVDFKTFTDPATGQTITSRTQKANLSDEQQRELFAKERELTAQALVTNGYVVNGKPRYNEVAEIMNNRGITPQSFGAPVATPTPVPTAAPSAPATAPAPATPAAIPTAVRSFRTIEEAEAARLPRGTRITIGGRPAEVQ
jgi:FeS assembly ATPase SufC